MNPNPKSNWCSSGCFGSYISQQSKLYLRWSKNYIWSHFKEPRFGYFLTNRSLSSLMNDLTVGIEKMLPKTWLSLVHEKLEVHLSFAIPTACYPLIWFWSFSWWILSSLALPILPSTFLCSNTLHYQRIALQQQSWVWPLPNIKLETGVEEYLPGVHSQILGMRFCSAPDFAFSLCTTAFQNDRIPMALQFCACRSFLDSGRKKVEISSMLNVLL